MTSETHTVRTDDGVDLHVIIEGPADAPLVLMSNSLGTDCTMWDGQAAAWEGKMRLVRYDKRGHGKSSLPPEDESTIERLGRDVLHILDDLDIDKVRYCGLSIGGMTGMWLGINAPERFTRLVLSNTAAFVGNPDAWNERIATVRAGGMEPFADAVLERWFTESFRMRETEKIEKVRKMLVATSVKGYCACSAAVRDMDQRAGLASIDLPTLVVSGAEDPATPPELGDAVAAGIPGAALLKIESAAHLSNIEKPEIFTDVVGEFLLRNG